MSDDKGEELLNLGDCYPGVTQENQQACVDRMNDSYLKTGSLYEAYLDRHGKVATRHRFKSERDRLDNMKVGDYIENVSLVEWLSLGPGRRDSLLDAYSRLGIQATPIRRHIRENGEKIQLVTQQTQNMYIVEAITDGLRNIDDSIQELVNKGD